MEQHMIDPLEAVTGQAGKGNHTGTSEGLAQSLEELGAQQAGMQTLEKEFQAILEDPVSQEQEKTKNEADELLAHAIFRTGPLNKPMQKLYDGFISGFITTQQLLSHVEYDLLSKAVQMTSAPLEKKLEKLTEFSTKVNVQLNGQTYRRNGNKELADLVDSMDPAFKSDPANYQFVRFARIKAGRSEEGQGLRGEYNSLFDDMTLYRRLRERAQTAIAKFDADAQTTIDEIAALGPQAEQSSDEELREKYNGAQRKLAQYTRDKDGVKAWTGKLKVKILQTDGRMNALNHQVEGYQAMLNKASKAQIKTEVQLSRLRQYSSSRQQSTNVQQLEGLLDGMVGDYDRLSPVINAIDTAEQMTWNRIEKIDFKVKDPKPYAGNLANASDINSRDSLDIDNEVDKALKRHASYRLA